MIFIIRFRSHWSMNVVGEAYPTFYPLLINKHLSSYLSMSTPTSNQAVKLFNVQGKVWNGDLQN